MSREILHHHIRKELQRKSQSEKEIPHYITENLAHKLRPYQREALLHFMYTQEREEIDEYNHLLFHMATGSGKTLILAACILYLFQKHKKQNFIFFVHSDAIVRKTYENLVHQNSSKYLFKKDGIVMDGEQVNIQLVDVFPGEVEPHTIYLKMTTIQKLHLDLNEPRENSMTFTSLKAHDIVLLADEAHHYFADTKRRNKKLTKREENIRSWEKTITSLFELNSSNRLLGFSATLNLNKDTLFQKMKEKIVYQYDLRSFMEDCYSKNVMVLRANEDDEAKMLHGALLSQYRKYIAEDHKINLKPVILFKSNKIATSLEANEKFTHFIENLAVSKLRKLIDRGITLYQGQKSVWTKMFVYYRAKDLTKVIRDLQWAFRRESILNANAQDFLTEENSLLLNSLEEMNNPIRAIFAVARLNEGWDVLNLFDIVRISEGGATNTKTTTDSEAQLIGRGARYYPFTYEGKSSYKRRFDDVNTDLKAIESLHYHTINDHTYIENLEKSLEEADIQVKEDLYEKVQIKVKDSFREHPVFNYGKIFMNERVPVSSQHYDHLKKYNIQTTYRVTFEKAIEHRLDQKSSENLSQDFHEYSWKVDRRFIQKAIQRRPFFYFNHLKKYIPSLQSMKNFIESDSFLGDLTILIKLPKEIIFKDLQPTEKLQMVEQFFAYMERKIRQHYRSKEGSTTFKGIKISKFITDCEIEINGFLISDDQRKDTAQLQEMKKYPWFIHEKAFIGPLENSLITFMANYYKRLKEDYDNIFLIKNEYNIKFYEIEGSGVLIPDFILYLEREKYIYQILILLKRENEHVGRNENLLSSLRERSFQSRENYIKIIVLPLFAEVSSVFQYFQGCFEKRLLEKN